MAINPKEVSTGEINLKTTKQLVNELEGKLGAYFNSVGYQVSWPNGISETLVDLWQQINKLEALYIDGLQEGYINGQRSTINSIGFKKETN